MNALMEGITQKAPKSTGVYTDYCGRCMCNHLAELMHCLEERAKLLNMDRIRSTFLMYSTGNVPQRSQSRFLGFIFVPQFSYLGKELLLA